jgi:hypothetical protein
MQKVINWILKLLGIKRDKPSINPEQELRGTAAGLMKAINEVSPRAIIEETADFIITVWAPAKAIPEIERLLPYFVPAVVKVTFKPLPWYCCRLKKMQFISLDRAAK